MSKRGLIGLLFLSVILFSVGCVSSQNVYCDDGTSTSCVHEDYTNVGCSNPSDMRKTGCWTYWESSAGVTTCQNLEEANFPTNFGLKWYSNNYVNPCNSYGTPNIKSCVEMSSGNAQCLEDCYKLKNEFGNDMGAFCTETSSIYNQGSVSAEATTFCQNYKTVGNGISEDMKCVKCSVGKVMGTYPNQNCEVPQISISQLGGSYGQNDKSHSGYAWATINLIDAAKFSSCEINWHDPVIESKWRSTTSLYDSVLMNNYYATEDKYTNDDDGETKTINVICTGIDGVVKTASKTLEVDLKDGGQCGDAEGRDFLTLTQSNSQLCKESNVKKDSFTTTTTGWEWICIGTNPNLEKSCSATRTGQTPDCPIGPEPSTINLGVQVPVYFAGTTEVCKTIIGTKVIIPTPEDPTGPCGGAKAEDNIAANTICSPIVVPVRCANNNNLIYGTITGTKDCTVPCPTGPDSNTICSGSFERVKNENNDVCKVIYGTKDCSSSETCSFTSAKWSPSGLVEKNEFVTMLLDGTSACAGKDITFKVYKSGITDSVTGSEETWQIGEPLPTWTTIGKQPGDTVNPKYYFTATLEENLNIKKSSLTDLEVADSIPLVAECVRIKKCSEYSQEQCGGDKCGVSQKSVFSFLGGTTKESQKCYQEKDYTCGWIVNPNKPNGGSCENVAVIRNTKTGCSQSFLEGDGANYPDEIGVCSYEDQTTDTCENDGFLDVIWEGTWSWAEGNEISMLDPTGEKAKCDKTTTKTEPCPSQVVLSFFTIKNIILVVAVIVLIYLVIKIKCGKKNSRKRK